MTQTSLVTGQYYRIEDPNSLTHYGVLGMKWGQHKAARYYADIQQHKRNQAVSKLRKKKNVGDISTSEFRQGRKRLNKQMKSNVKSYKSSLKKMKPQKGTPASKIYNKVGKQAYKEIPKYNVKTGARVASSVINGIWAGTTVHAAIAAAPLAITFGPAVAAACAASVGVTAGSRVLDAKIRKTISERTM